VTVFGNDDISRTATVQTDGTISLPLLGEVPVAGLAVEAIQVKLRELLNRYLVNPQVDVKVKEFNSQFVFLVGEFNSPGRKPLRGRTRLIDLLAGDAGGFNTRASGEILVTRADGAFEDGGKTLRMRLGASVPGPQEQARLETVLQSGDIITAFPKNYVTVEGEVVRPGRYMIEGELTVAGAISTAGGLTRFGSNDVKIIRVDPTKERPQVIEVDLKAIRNGKKRDIPLQPNDRVSVPRRLL
jgi:polysaccharide export outer membrane protein